MVYAALWQQQQGFYENGEYGGSGGGIFKSTDGGTTWNQLGGGLPAIIEANLAVAPSNPQTIYATVAPGAAPGAAAAAGGRGRRGGAIAFYKSTDGGATWQISGHDPRPMGRIGGGDLPTITVDPKNPEVVYDCSTVFYRTENGGETWSPVRGSPGGDDYQKSWVNPDNDNVILLVADQGGVVSANRGVSWSNWYTQNTAAMYHVTADDAFPYRLCGGQQDSGSACVQSRSTDGEITFHNWHPVNIEEYGEAAPDPANPDLVFGGKVSEYNRKTGQTARVAPPGAGRGSAYGRTVRTQPIIWSTVPHAHILYFGTNVIWKTLDDARNWTRISPDLTRGAHWTTPANAGKYASEVRPAALGTVTAIAPSPITNSVIWAGTGDGNIQVTNDGGLHWSNVTPPEIKPWTRIFNMDAGHFDTKTAYAAANTLRLDDMNPHFWRTHDGGKTWTEIDNGIAGGAVANSIREDPRVKGLLYAATDTQVWVSFDDGDNWHSLRQNMPAVSVRDIAVKDDASCLCADLVAGTHGRGFWILDDVTPLRQEAEAARAQSAYLYKPETGIRIRFATNDPTPWPPELPHGINPPAGPVIDYYLAQDASGPVQIQIWGPAATPGGPRQLVRSYTSADNSSGPNPADDPVAYNALCEQNPALAHCNMTMYWPAPPMNLSTQAGEHRIWWDMHYDAIAGVGGGRGGSTGAVPHRTETLPATPMAPPGNYTVKMIVDGKTYSQPLVFKNDPRVTPGASLDEAFTLTRELYYGAVATHAAYDAARAALAGATDAALRQQITKLAPAPPRGGGGRGGFGGFGGRGGFGGPPQPASLTSATTAQLTAADALAASDLPPTADALASARSAQAQARAVLAQWNALKAKLPGA
ncbi:MAG: WD40/YVTN/BNR-like repeat-containing protein [Terriglobales bacterium]